MMHFPPCFRFPPLFSENFQTLRKFFTIFTNFLIFIRRNFWWPFLVINHKFRLPLFSLFQYISALFRENYHFPPYFEKCTYWTPLVGSVPSLTSDTPGSMYSVLLSWFWAQTKLISSNFYPTFEHRPLESDQQSRPSRWLGCSYKYDWYAWYKKWTRRILPDRQVLCEQR